MDYYVPEITPTKRVGQYEIIINVHITPWL